MVLELQRVGDEHIIALNIKYDEYSVFVQLPLSLYLSAFPHLDKGSDQ